MKETYLFTKEELKLKYEGVDGITEEEADLRRKRYGNNELEAKEKKSKFSRFFYLYTVQKWRHP